MEAPLQKLAILDPDLAEDVRDIVLQSPTPIPESALAELVEATLNWVSVEITLGCALARGWARLLAAGMRDALARYRYQVEAGAREGPHLGRLMAEHLPLVLIAEDNSLPDRFNAAVSVMLTKGPYTLKTPLEALSQMLSNGDSASASAFIDLLNTSFSHNIPYNQSLHLCHDLPRSVLKFAPEKRAWLIQALTQAIAANIELADPMMNGMAKGLYRLSRDNLNQFVQEGLAHYQADNRQGQRFFALDSRLGLEALNRLRTCVTLDEVRDETARYLKARTGLSFWIQPMSDLPAYLRPLRIEAGISIISDQQSLYLPEEIDRFDDPAQNRALYISLAKLESALYEFGTYDFDLERAADIYGVRFPDDRDNALSSPDIVRFLAQFSCPDLARDLFTIFEHGRLRLALSRSYPGLLRQAEPFLRDETWRIWDKGVGDQPMARLYKALALGWTEAAISDDLKAVIDCFEMIMTSDAPVEASAFLVQETFDMAMDLVTVHDDAPSCLACRPLAVPFGRRLTFDSPSGAWTEVDTAARNIKQTLEKHGVKIYKSDVRALMAQNAGTLELAKIKDIPDLKNLLSEWDVPAFEIREHGDHGPAFYHQEWDCRIGDYLQDHVRVREHWLPDAGEDFYAKTLARHPGTVRRIQRAFDLLRPQGLTLLRQWVEGDDFDYRALLDFAVDRKSGQTPSDRLYIKRVKGQRDVAVLLLVDLSRSTANLSSGGEDSVLDVEKTAIVLFCEALRVVGDAFAVAGFSGTGRLGVDYFRIKDFDEDLTETVKGRIAAMNPCRATRTGAAIRHATEKLAEAPAAVRILLVLGDGFPNDLDYKQSYAIEDTRKAVLEAGARRVHTRAITVNMAQDIVLDNLYGPLRHNIISDVRELPDKLLGIYGALTRT